MRYCQTCFLCAGYSDLHPPTQPQHNSRSMFWTITWTEARFRLLVTIRLLTFAQWLSLTCQLKIQGRIHYTHQSMTTNNLIIKGINCKMTVNCWHLCFQYFTIFVQWNSLMYREMSNKITVTDGNYFKDYCLFTVYLCFWIS